MTATSVKLTDDKEIYTLKINATYYGLVWDKDNSTIHITEDNAATPLQAANAARKLKKYKDNGTPPDKTQAPSKNTDKVKKAEPVKLYSETEMAGMTHLRFREAWVVLSLKGLYVETSLTRDKVVKYNRNRDKAQVFKTYEEASMLLKTLDSVHEVGHTLKRFFIENKGPESLSERRNFWQ
jgi:hypothetical protein